MANKFERWCGLELWNNGRSVAQISEQPFWMLLDVTTSAWLQWRFRQPAESFSWRDIKKYGWWIRRCMGMGSQLHPMIGGCIEMRWCQLSAGIDREKAEKSLEPLSWKPRWKHLEDWGGGQDLGRSIGLVWCRFIMSIIFFLQRNVEPWMPRQQLSRKFGQSLNWRKRGRARLSSIAILRFKRLPWQWWLCGQPKEIRAGNGAVLWNRSACRFSTRASFRRRWVSKWRHEADLHKMGAIHGRCPTSAHYKNEAWHCHDSFSLQTCDQKPLQVHGYIIQGDQAICTWSSRRPTLSSWSSTRGLGAKEDSCTLNNMMIVCLRYTQT